MPESAAHVFDFREIADYIVENDDTATAANALRNAQDIIDAAARLLDHWSSHQLHGDWVYHQSRDWLKANGGRRGS